MKSVGNLKRRRLQPTTVLLTPVIVITLGTMGVVTPPVLSVREAQRANTDLVNELGVLEQSSTRLTELERDGGAGRIGAALRELDDLVPNATPELELHGILRASASLNGLQLQSLFIGEFDDPELPRIDDYVGRRKVRWSALGSPTQFVRFIESLRSLGLPVCVTEFSITRSATSFQIESTLSLFERTTPPPTAREDIPL